MPSFKIEVQHSPDWLIQADRNPHFARIRPLNSCRQVFSGESRIIGIM